MSQRTFTRTVVEEFPRVGDLLVEYALGAGSRGVVLSPKCEKLVLNGADSLRLRGKCDGSLDTLNQLDQVYPTDSPLVAAQRLDVRGHVQHDQGFYAAALATYQQALESLRDLDPGSEERADSGTAKNAQDRIAHLLGLTALTHMLWTEGDKALAKQNFGEAARRYLNSGNNVGAAYVDIREAELELLSGEEKNAFDFLSRQRVKDLEETSRVGAALSARTYARTYRHLGFGRKAVVSYQQALEAMQRLPAAYVRPKAAFMAEYASFLREISRKDEGDEGDEVYIKSLELEMEGLRLSRAMDHDLVRRRNRPSLDPCID